MYDSKAQLDLVCTVLMLGLDLAMNVSNAGGEDPRQAHTEGRLHRVPGQVEELRGNPCSYF